MKTLTQATLKELVHYSPETGVFTWAKARPACRLGGACGRFNAWGYQEIGLLKRLWPAHRLAWLYMMGELPPKHLDIDHINLDRADNRWSNLRLATRAQNSANTAPRSHNTSGVKCVRWVPERKKWVAQMRINGKQTNLGRFDTREEAAAKVEEAARSQWGEFWRAA